MSSVQRGRTGQRQSTGHMSLTLRCPGHQGQTPEQPGPGAVWVPCTEGDQESQPKAGSQTHKVRHIHTGTCTHTLVHILSQAYTLHMCTHTETQTHAHTGMHIHTDTHMLTLTHNTCTHEHTGTQTYRYMHTLTHKHTQRQTYTHAQ